MLTRILRFSFVTSLVCVLLTTGALQSRFEKAKVTRLCIDSDGATIDGEDTRNLVAGANDRGIHVRPPFRELLKGTGFLFNSEADDDEFLQVEKIPVKKAVEMAENGEMPDAKSLAALFLVRRYLNSPMGVRY